MVYLIPIAFCLFFSLRDDKYGGKCALGVYKESKWKYNIIFIWLVLISGFQYCVGYDIPIYMNTFEENKNMTFSDIWGDARYRPGWQFLQVLCHKISDDFIVLKLVQAVFLNLCVYSFLSRYSKYWFLTLFFYILYTYGELNFGAMRQSFAIGFFLLAIPYLEDKESKKESVIALIKYVCLVYVASLFHTSAFFLFLVPFLRFGISTKRSFIITIFVLIVATIIILQTSNLNMLLFSYMGFSDELIQNSEYYLTGGDYESKRSGIDLIKGLIPVLFTYICLFLNRHNRDAKNKVLQMLLFAYIIMATLNLLIPIFYRINEYFVFAYIVLIPVAIYEGISYHTSFKKTLPIVKFILFICFILYPVNHLVAVHPAFGFPGYRIYYPYYSVFDPQIDPERNRIIYLNLK